MKKSAIIIFILFTLFLAVSCYQPLEKPKSVELFEYTGSGENVTIENEYLSLLFMPETTEFILTDKGTGAQWRSNPPDPDSDTFANPITVQMMKSQIAMDYADISGIGMTLFSHEHGIKRGTYDFKVSGSTLEVSYTIGDIPRPFKIPAALPEDRMRSYLDLLEWGQQNEILANYRLYNINSLYEQDNREQLLIDYPDLENVNMYIMYDTKNLEFLEGLENYFDEAGYTYEDYVEDNERYGKKTKKADPVYSITVCYILDGRSLVVNIPFERIGYNSEYPVTQLTVLPFFGSGSTRDEGYMLVPDGSGSLIYFNNGKDNQEQFSVNVYGFDEASQPRNAIITDDKAPFPAFGIHKNNAALFCVIEEGASYASIRADVSGQLRSSWNRVYPIFDIIHSAKLNIVEKSQRDFYLYENNLPANESITMRYTVCAEPGYTGMAKEYRSWLLKRYPSLGSNKISGDIVPVAVEFIGAVNKTQHRLGLPFDLPLRLTSYEEMADMIGDFAEFGWKDVHVKLNGWFNRSVEHTVPTKLKLIDTLGSRNNFRQIINAAERNNFNVYPEVDFMFMRDVGLLSGFNLYSDASRYVNRERVQRYPYSFVWFGERKQWGKLNYLARPVISMKLIDNFMNKAAQLGIKNIAFKNMGSRLAGDYHERRRISREASKKMRQEKFTELSQSGNKMLINIGFDFSVPWASIVTDMIIKDQFFGITDTAVPFYQIALHGLVPFTGKAINLAEDYSKNLLKIIESGAGLYFSFIKEETSILQETKFRQFYANEYDKWIIDAKDLYDKFNRDFRHLYRQAIVAHEILSPDVTVTEYEDGTKVVVNASSNPYNYNGQTIMPGTKDSYIIVKQGPAR